jgi:ATP-dependent DNA helicase RecG
MKEAQNIEFKTSWQDEYLKIISAFANCSGGKIYIGIDDKGNVAGIKNVKELLETLPNKIRNKLGIIVSVNLLKQDNKEYLEVEVKPATFPVSYEGKFYIRSGSTTQELTGQELTNFLLEKSGITWDERCEEETNNNDIDIFTIEKFKDLARDKIPSIIQEQNTNRIFQKLNLFKNETIKRAGILLFGKDPQRFYPQAVVKIGRFKGSTEILFHDLIEGNLFEQLEKTLEILKSKYLISKIEFEGIQRKEKLEYPYEALREAIINALIHRDYLGTSNVQIRVYDDKLIIMNEGKLPPELSIEKLKTDHLSKPRNPLLASIFYFAGFIESWGSGTLKIINTCKNEGLPEPDFENDSGIMNVIFYKDIFTEENLRKMGLNERQIKGVIYAKENGTITLSEYRQLVQRKVEERTLRRDLEDLVNNNVLKPIGEKKGRYYELLK